MAWKWRHISIYGCRQAIFTSSLTSLKLWRGIKAIEMEQFTCSESKFGKCLLLIKNYFHSKSILLHRFFGLLLFTVLWEYQFISKYATFFLKIRSCKKRNLSLAFTYKSCEMYILSIPSFLIVQFFSIHWSSPQKEDHYCKFKPVPGEKLQLSAGRWLVFFPIKTKFELHIEKTQIRTEPALLKVIGVRLCDAATPKHNKVKWISSIGIFSLNNTLIFDFSPFYNWYMYINIQIHNILYMSFFDL